MDRKECVYVITLLGGSQVTILLLSAVQYEIKDCVRGQSLLHDWWAIFIVATIKIAHQSWEKENNKDSCFCMISFHLAAISLDQLIVFATIVTLHGSDLDIYQLDRG